MLLTRTKLIALAAVFALTACSKNDEDKGKKPNKPKQPVARKTPVKKPEAKPVKKPEIETPVDNPNIEGKEVTYKAGKTTLKGYIAWDKTKEGTRPGILIVHEWWGHNNYVRKRARMLAELGYTAFALDMYGDGKNTTHPKDAQKFMMQSMKHIDESIKRFKAAEALLKKDPHTNPKKISAIGYCFGGGVVLTMARLGLPLDGVASFHGSLAPIKGKEAKKGKLKAKLLVLQGADDPFAPKKVVEAFKKEMKDAGANLQFHAYPGAVHAFTNPDATAIGNKYKLPLAYDRKADEDSWNRLKEFLGKMYPVAK